MASLQHAADGGGGSLDFTRAEPEEREPRRHLVPGLARLPVRRLRLGVFAAQPVQLGPLVDGETQRGVRRLRQAFPRPIDLRCRGGPFAMRLKDLGTVHQALAPVGHEVGLRVTPSPQRLRPLRRAS